MGKDEILIRCDCGYNHFLSLEEFDKYILFEVIDIPCSLTQRIKKALRYIFKGGKLYWHDILLDKESAKLIKNKLDLYIKKSTIG
jgi:hypothetical protein